ncbi:hypothetical protein ACFE04_027342 [Oxalis oulophora]
MSLALEIESIFSQESERVKSVDFHPTEPWILASLHSGTVSIWNYQTKAIEKSIKVTESPVRSAKFIARNHWIVVGSDVGHIYIYNYDTMEKIKEVEAHSDFIRSVVVHPTLPYLLSASDDKLIKLWDWENDWICTRVFEGHDHYVMDVTINPMDVNVFASASLDNTAKIWNFDSSEPKLTLEQHLKGLNCVNYSVIGNKSYLLTGSDDFTTKVWDYENQTCVQALEGHTNNVTAVCVHPELPIIITCSEDQTVRFWDSASYRLEKTVNYDLGRVWTIGYVKGSLQVVFGCDKGLVMVKLSGSEIIHT